MLSSFYTTDRSVVWWQVACYGCLDVLTKVVFGYVLMSSYSIIERVESAEVAECAATQALPLPQVLTQMFSQLCVLWICVPRACRWQQGHAVSLLHHSVPWSVRISVVLHAPLVQDPWQIMDQLGQVEA